MRGWWMLVLLAGCGRATVEDVRVDLVRPGVARVQFTSSRPGVGGVVATADGHEVVTPEGPESEAHAVTVLGLKPDRAYTFRPVLDGEPVDAAVEAVTPATGAPEVALVVHDEAAACDDGWFLLSLSELFGESWVVVVDRDGDVVWAEEGPNQAFVTRVRPGLDGRSILYNLGDAHRVDDIGEVVRVPLDGGEGPRTRTRNAHHDFVELPDGTIGWIGYDFREDLEVEGEVLDVAADVILEDDEGVTSPDTARTVWSVLEDYPPGVWLLDSGEMDPGHFLPEWSEFSHANSLMHRAADDAWFVMFRWLDALVKIDRATGEQVWQLGGAHSDFTAPDGHAFSHAHMSELWDGGMLLFDNADSTGRVSGAVEYAFDEAARSYEKVWEYRDPDGGFELILGDAARMRRCDNVLISWSTQRRLTEVTRDGRIAWELQAAPGWLVGRAVPLVDLYDLRAE